MIGLVREICKPVLKLDFMAHGKMESLSEFELILLGILRFLSLKVPKCEIFDRSDFHDFYPIKSLWEGDFGVKIKCF
jgi:hypothetical protein